MDEPGGEEARRQQFLPDQLIRALEALRPRLEAFDENHRQSVAHGKPETLCELPSGNGDLWGNRVYIPEPAISANETRRLTLDTVQSLDPDAGDRLATAFTNGWVEEKKAHAAGFAIGMCSAEDHPKDVGERPATIFMTYDGTVNDPAYLAHESGHFYAAARRSRHPSSKTGRSRVGNAMAEIQAFVFQHAFLRSGLKS